MGNNFLFSGIKQVKECTVVETTTSTPTITTPKGIISINGDTSQTQFLDTVLQSNAVKWIDNGNTHILQLPFAHTIGTLGGLVSYNELKAIVDSQEPFDKRLRDSWYIKKNLSSMISNPEIDTMTSLAYDNGATAWKILGAGGGGFLLVYIDPSEYQYLKNAMSGYRELPFKFEPFGSRIIFNYR